MLRRLRIPVLILSLLALVGSFTYLVFGDGIRAELERRQRVIDDANSSAYARRLRDDGDRLAREGAYEDALARYNQADEYDPNNPTAEVLKKLDAIKQHVGAVAFDKDFQPPANPASKP
jgi:tetratricopeptide (TPR) repeat protein